MKKFISLFICCLLLFSALGTFAYTDIELAVKTVKVNLAQNTVTLNEEPLTLTQNPYVNDNGDTMIELNLLVNALGAEIEEVEGYFCVTMNDVAIHYTLNSDIVTIGEQNITMPSSVVMAENGVVMAPLRFVAEALGADVTYNGELREIVIVSAGGIDEAANYALLFRYSGKNKIGHSEEHWRFTKSDNFDMSDSFYEGMYEFAIDDIMLSLTVEKKRESNSLEKYYIQMQAISPYDRMVMYDKGKGSHNNVPYVFAKFRTLDTISERYAYEAEEYFYLIAIERNYESFAVAKENADVEAFLQSLEFTYAGGDDDETVDLAKVDLSVEESQEKKTEYVDGNYNWSVQLNGTWEVDEYYGFYNKVIIESSSEIETDEAEFDDYYYYDDYVISPTITVTTYSNEENKTASQLANEKRKLYMDTVNAEVYEVFDVQNIKIGNCQAYYFELRYAEGSNNYVQRLYYINDNAYRYEIELFYDEREEEQTDFLSNAEAVIQSFTPGSINANEVGAALEPDSETELIDTLTEFKGELFTITHPCMWMVTESDTGLLLSQNNSSLNMSSLDMLSFILPQLSFLLAATDDVSVQVTKGSLVYYDDEMNQKYYSAEAYMNKTIAGILNTSNALFKVTMPTQIQEVILMGRKAYLAELVIEAEATKMYFTTYYLPYGENEIISVTKTCADRYKNTIYEKALDKAIASLKLS